MAVKKKTTTRKRPAQNDPAAKILDAALDWAAESGWRSLKMTDIAEATGFNLGQIHAVYPCKASILNGLVRRIDEQVLNDGDADGDGIRDRLFDLLMRRFDALNNIKPAIKSMASDSLFDPIAALVSGPRMLSSMYWMLDAAGVNVSGLLGLVRCQGLLIIYANGFRVWLKDDSEDMSPTMAALDHGLRQAERLESCRRGR
jgi:AcrR family transcriptional regulator